jgi:hypothetical protein
MMARQKSFGNSAAARLFVARRRHAEFASLCYAARPEFAARHDGET